MDWFFCEKDPLPDTFHNFFHAIRDRFGCKRSRSPRIPGTEEYGFDFTLELWHGDSPGHVVLQSRRRFPLLRPSGTLRYDRVKNGNSEPGIRVGAGLVDLSPRFVASRTGPDRGHDEFDQCIDREDLPLIHGKTGVITLIEAKRSDYIVLQPVGENRQSHSAPPARNSRISSSSMRVFFVFHTSLEKIIPTHGMGNIDQLFRSTICRNSHSKFL